MTRRKVKTAKLEIIQCGTKMFLEKGYKATSPKDICEALNTGTGNLTYYFPTKEHLLVVLVDMLCDFQWKKMEEEAGDGISSIMAICLEVAAMAAICETDPVAKDFYTAAYTSPMCLEIIRKNDVIRAKKVFGAYCPNWKEEHFIGAEAIVSGIEYGALMAEGAGISLENRIAAALNAILQTYQIPVELRRQKIRRVLEMDYHTLAQRVLRDFKLFVERTNEQALKDQYQQAT